MRVDVGTRRVAIFVQPRLLADVLQRSLARPDVDVVVITDASDTGEVIAADVVIVTHEPPDRVVADVVVRIPDPAGSAQGSITTPSGREPVVLGDLTAVLEALDRLLRSG